jgi:peptidoglycan/LPS O-acetylase OafA/YrhL
MRAIGMTMVLAHHTHFQTIASKKGVFGPILDRMDFGVTLFFVLSGFLLYRPFVLAMFVDRPQTPTRSFLRRRVLRVIPGYWFAVAVVVVFFGLAIHNINDVFAYFGLLQPFSASRAFNDASIKQSWSLTAEFMFYLMLPFYAMAVRRFARRRPIEQRLRIALAGAAILYAIGVLFRAYFVYADPSWQAQGAIVLPGWIDIIAIGMAMAAFSAAEQVGVAPPRWIRSLGDHPGLAWGLGFALLFALTRVATPEKPYFFDSEYMLRYFVFGAAGLLLLFPAMFGDQTKGRLRAVLRSRPLVILGTVSLGVYLIHRAILVDLFDRIYPDGTTMYGGQGSFPLLFVLTFVLSVAFALFSYYVVETPFLKLKYRGRKEPKPASEKVS